MKPVIELKDLWVRHGNRNVLSNISLTVEQGEILAILGPSGCGKSTLLRAILGFMPPERGVIRLADQEVSANGAILTPPEDRNLAMVFQYLALWPHLTVYGNLAFGLKSRKIEKAKRDHIISEMLQRVDLYRYRDQYPGELSGGERQRVAIARALVLDPHAVLFDEPLSNLDVVLKKELLTMFRELLRERKIAAVYVTHDVREAISLGDRVAVLMEGELVQIGAWEELRSRPAHSYIQHILSGLRWVGLH